MRFNNTFIIIVAISLTLGTLLAILTDNSEINQKPNGRNNLRKKNTTSEITNMTNITDITHNTNITNKNNITNKTNSIDIINKTNITNKNNITNTANTTNTTNTTNISNITDSDQSKNSNDSNKNTGGIKNIVDEDDDEDESDKRNPIPIAISINDKYTLPALVFVTSLMEHIGPKTKYEIYVMTADGYPENNKVKFNKLVKKYGEEKLKVAFLNMKDRYVPHTYGIHITKETYFRVYLSDLLPNIDKLLYLDVDMINFKDLTEVYNMNMENKLYIYAMVDDYNHRAELYRFNIKPDKYLNAGTLLMDLKKIKASGFDKKLQKFISQNSNSLEHHDQTAINVVYNNHLGVLPIRYVIFNFNTFQDLVNFNNAQDKKYRRSEGELKEAYNNPFLIHYAGYTKPWEKKQSTFREYWWYYAKKSEFYKEILQKYSMSEEEVDDILKGITIK